MFVSAMKVAGGLLPATFLAVVVPLSMAQPLTIHEIQYTDADDGASPYNGQVVDCVGGIVVAKYLGWRPRLILQDPLYPLGWDYRDGWCAIQVKDWTYDHVLWDNVRIGDWVEFTNVQVEDFRGTTFLQWMTPLNPTFNIVSEGNPLPPHVIVAVSDTPAPLYDPGPGTWFVEHHEAERFESMRLIVRDVMVTAMDLGKADDNYNLQNPQGESCWASDYMNVNAVGDYHPFVTLDQHFCAVAGVFEQYTKLSIDFDYYQLLTQNTVDLALCGDGNSDGLVAPDDWPRCEECLLGPQCGEAPEGCNPPAWTWEPWSLPVQHCLMMDFDYDGDMDLLDFAELQTIVGTP
ncbi:MAG: hypothetical protein KAY37_08415 [Phycisphaerae bacterium]|nr:hypothetical protein [Phycisphaerae bacterium]